MGLSLESMPYFASLLRYEIACLFFVSRDDLLEIRVEILHGLLHRVGCFHEFLLVPLDGPAELSILEAHLRQLFFECFVRGVVVLVKAGDVQAAFGLELIGHRTVAVDRLL